MRQPRSSKIQRLAARHPGLRDRVHTMFAELWPAAAIVHMIRVQYGERLGLRSIERYKSQHWRAQGPLAEPLGAGQ